VHEDPEADQHDPDREGDRVGVNAGGQEESGPERANQRSERSGSRQPSHGGAGRRQRLQLLLDDHWGDAAEDERRQEERGARQRDDRLEAVAAHVLAEQLDQRSGAHRERAANDQQRAEQAVRLDLVDELPERPGPGRDPRQDDADDARVRVQRDPDVRREHPRREDLEHEDGARREEHHRCPSGRPHARNYPGRPGRHRARLRPAATCIGCPTVRIDADFWADRRVLVTGHTGFKGAWLTLWLTSLGARVSGLARGAASPAAHSAVAAMRATADVETLRADLADANAVGAAFEHAQPEILIHLAAQPFVRRSFRDPYGTWQSNLVGTLNVLEVLRRQHSLGVAIIVTSDRSYDERGQTRPLVESDPLGGDDPYASSKAAAELAVNAWRSSFFAEDGPRLATARTGNVIGGGDWGEARLIADILRGAEEDAPIRIRNPDSVRAWQHVLAPLAGYLVLAERLWDDATFAEAWNFAPPPEDAKSVRWVTERLTELWPGDLNWQLDRGPNPPEAPRATLDSTKARARLGWFSPWDLEHALRKTVDWHVALGDGRDMRAVSLAQIEAFAEAAQAVA
jgi:CDP-glucose 4,6-dehydratase